VVEPYPSEKWWSSSVGMMTFPIYGKIKFMFQTTNQEKSCNKNWIHPIQRWYSMIFLYFLINKWVYLNMGYTTEWWCCRIFWEGKLWLTDEPMDLVVSNFQTNPNWDYNRHKQVITGALAKNFWEYHWTFFGGTIPGISQKTYGIRWLKKNNNQAQIGWKIINHD